jgi:hypothetical protein
MGYLGLRQPLIFSCPADTPENVAEDAESAIEIALQENKYKNFPLTSDLTQALLDEVKRVMTSEQAFLNPKLSLPELANKLGASAYYLSQTINEQAARFGDLELSKSIPFDFNYATIGRC